ncbi:MAG: hypothetical protein AAGE86_00270 [Pseudomonadota bacterium]
MSLRISSAAALAVLLTACATESPAPDGDMIACAIGPGADYSKVCTLEEVGEGEFLIHSPNGGFRRLLFDPQAGEFGAVNGADALEILSQDGSIAEFEIGGDRYRIPHSLVAPEAE